MTVRYPDFATPIAVSHPAHGMFVTLVPGQVFEDNDALAISRPELFIPDGVAQDRPAPVESVAIEAASAAPGEKRGRRRR